MTKTWEKNKSKKKKQNSCSCLTDKDFCFHDKNLNRIFLLVYVSMRSVATRTCGSIFPPVGGGGGRSSPPPPPPI
jgi:hypothetical protein